MMQKKADCYVCGKHDLPRNEIGLNQKLIAKDITKFHCLECLADYLDISVEDLEDRIQEYKEAGCTLFE